MKNSSVINVEKEEVVLLKIYRYTLDDRAAVWYLGGSNFSGWPNMLFKMAD